MTVSMDMTGRRFGALVVVEFGVSLAAIGPNSDEFDAAIDAARAAASGEGMGEAASSATRF